METYYIPCDWCGGLEDFNAFPDSPFLHCRCRRCQDRLFMSSIEGRAHFKRVKSADRRAKRLDRASTLTLIEWEMVLISSKGRCQYCNSPYTTSNLHLDHIIPLARNGTNVISNVAAACSSCNLTKSCLIRSPLFPTLVDHVQVTRISLC